MKVLIQNRNAGSDISIHVPNGLFLNRCTASIASHIIYRESGIKITTRLLMQAVSSIKKYKKSHDDFNLVEVTQTSGEEVIIRF